MHRRRLSNSCSGGPCPTLYVDDVTGEVTVQGYVTTLPGGRVPIGEDVVAIPADAWMRLLAGLPPRMLIAALFRRPVRARSLSGSP